MTTATVWPDEFLLPDYQGGSIANIPATLANLLGVPFSGLPPLRPALWQPLGDDLRRVVLFIVDAFGANLVTPDVEASMVSRPAVDHRLTSVFPSTTVTALSCLWTGASPAQHGLVGLKLFFPEYAVLGQMIHFGPNFMAAPGALVEVGLEPVEFLSTPGLAQQLAAGGVATYSLIYRDYIRSSLSQMHARGARETIGVYSVADLLVQLRRLLEARAGERLAIVAYWHTVDLLSHAHGPAHPAVSAELRAILGQLQTELLDRLSPAARAGTALFMTGDHGQIVAPEAQTRRLAEDPVLQRLLLMRPAGEPRVPYLYARQGAAGELLAHLQAHYEPALVALPAGQALAEGLWGPGPVAPAVPARLGDVVAVMRQGYTLQAPPDEQHDFRARHGSLTRDEMAVPWWGWRLDA